MKNIGKLILSVLLVVFSTNVLLAFDHNQDKGKKDGGKDPVGNKAGCAPATSRLTMSFNDVKALIEPGGLLWLDRANGVAGYEVPKASGATPNPTSIYSGALWMGGY